MGLSNQARRGFLGGQFKGCIGVVQGLLLLLPCRAMLAADAPASEVHCHQLVPTPFDVSPLRSPQHLHTVLAHKFVGRNIVEIGTRNGDGVNCFSRVANHTVAIEVLPPYCSNLRKRVETGGKNASAQYEVICTTYQKAPAAIWTDVDFVTWWIEGGLRNNIAALRFMHGVRRQLRSGALALTAYDNTDLLTPVALQPIAEYMELVPPSQHECEVCLSRLESNHGRGGGLDGHVLRRVGCDRSTSLFYLIAIRIDSPQLERFLAAPSMPNAQHGHGHGTPNSSQTGTCRRVGNNTPGHRTRIEFKAPPIDGRWAPRAT